MQIPLLTRMHDETGDMGLVFEKSPKECPGNFAFARPALVMLLDSSQCAVKLSGKMGGMFELDSAGMLVLPAGVSFSLICRSSLLSLCVCLPSPQLIEKVCGFYHLTTADLQEIFASPRMLPKTLWVREVYHRYVFERLICRRKDNFVTEFLEAEIVKELYYVCKDTQAKSSRTHFLRSSDAALQKALEHIEAHLTRKIHIAELVALCGKSESSLSRLFRAEFGLSPYQYIQSRRLDEARLLLMTGRYTVGSVAGLVGYEDVRSFTQAFKAKHGCLPSDLLETTKS